MTDEPRLEAYYFGTYRRSGHYLFDMGMNEVRGQFAGDAKSPVPWGWAIDGKLNPNEREGEARLHHKDGWTALAFANRTDDSRPGSNSVFLVNRHLTFLEAVVYFIDLFPQVVQRFKFQIVEVT